MDKYQQEDYEWGECLWKIARKELAIFENDNISYIDHIIEFKSRRHIMTWIYSHLVGYKKAPRIQDLAPDVKKEMWAVTKEMCAGRVKEVWQMVEISKVFYVIDYFFNEKYNIYEKPS